jgi:hypothetical protein
VSRHTAICRRDKWHAADQRPSSARIHACGARGSRDGSGAQLPPRRVSATVASDAPTQDAAGACLLDPAATPPTQRDTGAHHDEHGDAPAHDDHRPDEDREGAAHDHHHIDPPAHDNADAHPAAADHHDVRPTSHHDDDHYPHPPAATTHDHHRDALSAAADHAAARHDLRHDVLRFTDRF